MRFPTTQCDHCEAEAVELYSEATGFGRTRSIYECECGGVTVRHQDYSTFSGMFVNRADR